MSDDALKALLSADPAPASVPAVDYAFTISVMETVERRRFRENVALLVLAGVVISALLWLVMPYITPALATLSADVIPAAVALVSLAAVAFGYSQIRPALREFGLNL